MRRRFPRFSVCAQARIFRGDRVFNGEVDNLSLAGIFVRIQEVFNPGEGVRVGIIYESNSNPISITVSGEIVHTSEDGIGVKFTEMELETFALLRNIITHNSMITQELLEEYRTFMKIMTEESLSS